MLILVATLVAIAGPPAIAVERAPAATLAVLELDPAKTTIAYSLEGWPHHTQGTFALKHGVIRIDPRSGKMDGVVVIDAASGNSGHSVRDERMNSSVLEVSRFPEVSFAPRQVISHGEARGTFPVRVRGVFMLHGTAHDFTIDASVTRGTDAATIHCRFGVPYVEWGLEDPSILMFKVAKTVDIEVTTIARISWVATFAMPTGASSIPDRGAAAEPAP
jgi:polyisoprenoid-binding protein YceI